MESTHVTFTPETLLEHLDSQQISYEKHEHPPVYTCEEAELHLSHLTGLGTKNLFLREEKGPRIFLVAVPDAKRVHLNNLRFILESQRLTFGEPELLWECLGVQPGSVTIFGIANDRAKRVELYLDKALVEAEKIHAHPLRNTASLLLSPEEALRFLDGIGREARVIDVPERNVAVQVP